VPSTEPPPPLFGVAGRDAGGTDTSVVNDRSTPPLTYRTSTGTADPSPVTSVWSENVENPFPSMLPTKYVCDRTTSVSSTATTTPPTSVPPTLLAVAESSSVPPRRVVSTPERITRPGFVGSANRASNRSVTVRRSPSSTYASERSTG
jgi:hypothetical protein